MKLRSVLTALALVVAPGVAVIGTSTDALAVTKISHATATSLFRSSAGDVIDVYAEVRAPLLHLPNYTVTAFGERLDRHGAEPGFVVVVAYANGHPVGYA